MNEIKKLKGKRNLLLFNDDLNSNFLLYKFIELNIHFDILFLQYNDNSASYDKILDISKIYDKKFYIKRFNKPFCNIEDSLNEIYNYYCKEIDKNYYKNIVVGTNLNDKLNRSFNNFAIGMDCKDIFGDINIDNIFSRPLINVREKSIIEYIDNKNILYTDFKQDRLNFIDEYIDMNYNGIIESLKLIKDEIEHKNLIYDIYVSRDDLKILEPHDKYNTIEIIKNILKNNYHKILSSNEIYKLRKNRELVFNDLVVGYNDKFIFIGKHYKTDDKISERYNKLDIPKSIQYNIAKNSIIF